MKTKISLILLFAFGSFFAQAAQNPSPMQENIRKHERIEQKEFPGIKTEVTGVLPRPAGIFLPEKYTAEDTLTLLVHFHGPAYLAENAVSQYEKPAASVAVQLGSGSSVYGKPFENTGNFSKLIDSAQAKISASLGRQISFDRIVLSGWSAGYGAVRAILRNPETFDKIDGVLLLDGIHASYEPEGKSLYEGGEVNPADLDSFLLYAEAAARPGSRKAFIITHSEIFPGTYVSTTEATDWLLGELGLSRTPVLEWGPLGMQQLGNAGKNNFRVLSFAGNSAPDHVDHVHALYHFLKMMYNK